MKRDDRGLSLIELIIAVSISAIILGAATMFLGRAQKSYQLAETTIDMQAEAQVLLEQLGSWVMESNHVDIETNGGARGTVMILCNIPSNKDVVDAEGTVLGARKTKRRIIWLDQPNQTMYMVEDEQDAGVPVNFAAYKVTPEDADSKFKEEYCISQYIVTFSASHRDETPQKVTLRLRFKEGSSDAYEVQNIFTMRNGYIE